MFIFSSDIFNLNNGVDSLAFTFAKTFQYIFTDTKTHDTKKVKSIYWFLNVGFLICFALSTYAGGFMLICVIWINSQVTKLHYEVFSRSGFCLHPPTHQGSGAPLGTLSRSGCSDGLQPQTGIKCFVQNILNDLEDWCPVVHGEVGVTWTAVLFLCYFKRRKTNFQP